MAYVEVEIDVEDYLEDVSTDALKTELLRRKVEPDCPLPERPSHVISDLKKAFETQNPHEFYYILRRWSDCWRLSMDDRQKPAGWGWFRVYDRTRHHNPQRSATPRSVRTVPARQ